MENSPAKQVFRVNPFSDCTVNTRQVECECAKKEEEGCRCKNGYLEKKLVNCFHV
jgi:hypothetical protein